MKLKEIMTSCISKPRKIEKKYPSSYQKQGVESNVYYVLGCKNQEVESSNYYDLVKKIQQGEITLEVLENLRKLKIDEKKSLLADAAEMMPNNRLHDLNEKIIEYALDLVDSKDSAFLLRRTKEDGLFRDLMYLEAKENGFTAAIDKKGTLKINFPSVVLELYKLLIDNFYLKKFEDEELQKKLYQELLPDVKIPFEKLNFFENFIESLKEFYIKNSLALSIMVLFISRDIKEHAVCEELLELDTFKKSFEKKMPLYGTSADSKLLVVDYVLNDVKGVYMVNLASSNILDLAMHGQSNNATMESIEILGSSEGSV